MEFKTYTIHKFIKGFFPPAPVKNVTSQFNWTQTDGEKEGII
jgi:hypothetical protein